MKICFEYTNERDDLRLLFCLILLKIVLNPLVTETFYKPFFFGKPEKRKYITYKLFLKFLAECPDGFITWGSQELQDFCQRGELIKRFLVQPVVIL